MKRERFTLFGIVTTVLALAALACNISAAPTPEPSPGTPFSATPETLPAACTLGASLLADVNVPDGSQFAPNTPFPKTWSLQNSGSCDWEAGSQLVYVSGDALGASGSVGVPPVLAGASTEITVNFTSPATPGTYTSYWQMRSADGVLFGDLIYVEIVVPSPTAVPAAEWDLYRSGDHGPVVYAIQYLLKAEGYALTADGSFGPQTASAVKSFQTAKGLTVDGIVGPNTWQALVQGNTVKTGSHGHAVRAVQYLLANLYGYGIAVDGIFGPDTDNTVRDFQTSHGLTVDGIVGPNTWKALVAGP